MGHRCVVHCWVLRCKVASGLDFTCGTRSVSGIPLGHGALPAAGIPLWGTDALCVAGHCVARLLPAWVSHVAHDLLLGFHWCCRPPAPPDHRRRRPRLQARARAEPADERRRASIHKGGGIFRAGIFLHFVRPTTCAESPDGVRANRNLVDRRSRVYLPLPFRPMAHCAIVDDSLKVRVEGPNHLSPIALFYPEPTCKNGGTLPQTE